MWRSRRVLVLLLGTVFSPIVCRVRDVFVKERQELFSYCATHEHIDCDTPRIVTGRIWEMIAVHPTQLQLRDGQTPMCVPENREFVFIEEHFDMKAKSTDKLVK